VANETSATVGPPASDGQPSDLVQQPFNSREFRAALGSFATGVTVVTTSGAGHAYGLTANAFSSVSLDPPLVLVCVNNGTRGSESIETNGVFAVNILSADQEPLSRYFATRDRPRGPEAFSHIPHRSETTGSPILEGVAAYLDCRLAARYLAGDHVIFIGDVMAIGLAPDVEPLLFHQGQYRYFSPT
jgi:flavin reductase (DIM6/NTAB) family NADH-FMN oxidoreductase RutF